MFKVNYKDNRTTSLPTGLGEQPIPPRSQLPTLNVFKANNNEVIQQMSIMSIYYLTYECNFLRITKLRFQIFPYTFLGFKLYKWYHNAQHLTFTLSVAKQCDKNFDENIDKL